jgi:hypothetical protein
MTNDLPISQCSIQQSTCGYTYVATSQGPSHLE